jgi:hypothetical protein
MRSIRQAVGLALFFIAVYIAAGHMRAGIPSLVLEPVKPQFTHDEFIRYVIRARPRWLERQLRGAVFSVQVIQNGKPIRTIGGQKEIALSYDPGEKAWAGDWPCPWNAPEGIYRVRLSTAALSATTGPLRITVRPFEIMGRKPAPFPNGFAALTVEDLADLRGIHWPGPDGKKGDWRVLVDWAQFIHADALWILSADSGGYAVTPPDNHPWNDRAVSTIRALGAECHRRGLKFGVWTMCYLVGGSPEQSPNYIYAWEYNQGRLIDGRTKRGRRAISILDPKRPRDIVQLVSTWAALPEVDYIGLDYIRNALGGYEAADQFVDEMRIPVPPQWHAWSKSEQMMWVAKKKVVRKDADFIDAWQWWRAHKVSSIIRTIKAAVGTRKPLWVFTLSWDRGWQHGQDPVMFRDAGADLDAVMLYECDKSQFDDLIKDWGGYLRADQVNLLAGDCVDWFLHQRDPSGPQEFKRRILLGYHHLNRNGPAKGVFIHDLHRALRGRTGPWGTKGWMGAAAEVIDEIKRPGP